MIGPADVPSALPTVITPDEAPSSGSISLVGLDGGTITGRFIGEVPALPGAGADASLVDLTMAERFLSGPFTDDATEVWLTDDAPADIVARLAQRGITVTAVDSAMAQENALAHGGVSLAYSLFLLAAVAAGALAVGATAFAVVASARRRSGEFAVLRALGLPRRLLRRSVEMEQVLTLGTGVVVGTVVGMVAAVVALRSIPEFVTLGPGPPLQMALPGTALGDHRGCHRGGTRSYREHRCIDGGQGGLGRQARRSSVKPAPEVPMDRPDGNGVRRLPGDAVRLSGVVHLFRQRGADIVALRGVDLDVDGGEMVALLGPSGMGKTTVLRIIAGLIRPSAGMVRVGAHDLSGLSAAHRRALRGGEIAHIVQGTSPNLLPFATALQNVWFSQHGARQRGWQPPWEPHEVLDMLGLDEVADQRVARLPRGLQQQVALAAGVAAGPQLVLADEPTVQLGEEASVKIVSLLERINAELGTTVIIVTHDPMVAAKFPRTVTIRDGRVGAEGRHGQEYAVVDSSGSIQLPPDVLQILPPNTRVRIIRGPDGVELRSPEAER